MEYDPSRSVLTPLLSPAITCAPIRGYLSSADVTTPLTVTVPPLCANTGSANISSTMFMNRDLVFCMV